MEQQFKIERDGFAVGEKNAYLLVGSLPDEAARKHRFCARFCGRALPLAVIVQTGQMLCLGGPSEKERHTVDRKYALCISLPDLRKPGGALEVFECFEDEEVLFYRIDFFRLQRKRRELPHGLDGCRLQGKEIVVSGWLMGEEAYHVSVRDARGRSLPVCLTWRQRMDIVTNYPELFGGRRQPEEKLACGFEAVFAAPADAAARVTLACGALRCAYDIKIRQGAPELIRADGLLGLKDWIRHRKKAPVPAPAKAAEQPGGALSGEKEKEVQKEREPSVQPLISIVVPLYHTPEIYLRELVNSVRAQKWQKWELCLSDGGGKDSALTGVLEELRREDGRVRTAQSKKPLGIADNTNAALHLAGGDYVVFADHDDLLAPEALLACVRALKEHPGAELLYTDEDKVSMDGKSFFMPHYKPDYNEDLFRSVNYICHLLMVKKSLLEKTGGLDGRFDGAQDYDLALRCIEQAEEVCHVPGILYHWRAHPDSTAGDAASKQYAFEAGRRALQAHLDRLHIDARVLQGKRPGLYRVVYGSEETPDISVISVNPGMTAAEANAQAKKAGGTFLLFLDGQFAPADDDSLRRMAGYAASEGVGAVGGLVRYPDGAVCQAGVVLGEKGRIWMTFAGKPADDPGYFARLECAASVAALPFNCMMLSREKFEELGGFDEAFERYYYGIDLCLRLKKAGRRAVFDPQAAFVSSSPRIRTHTLTEELQAAYEKERALFCSRWQGFGENPQIRHMDIDFCL